MGFEPVWMSSADAAKQPPKIETHAVFDRLLHEIPNDVLASFTTEQLAVLAKATKPPTTRHFIDYRVSVPFIGGRYYLTLFFGKERRGLSRIRSEGQASLTKASILYVAILWIVFSVGLLASLVLIYVIKSAMGIDLFYGPSFLHDFAFIRTQLD